MAPGADDGAARAAAENERVSLALAASQRRGGGAAGPEAQDADGEGHEEREKRQ